MSLPMVGLISHGTSSAEGRTVIEALAAAISEDLATRGLVGGVMLGHVDVQRPDVAEVISTLPHDSPVILVPLLLSPGYHVHVDLAEAVRAALRGEGTDASGGSAPRDIRLTPTLGPDPRLAQVLAQRLSDLDDEDQVVLAAAGSSDNRATDACLEMAESLAQELARPVVAGFHAGEGARLSGIVEQRRRSGGRVVLSSYLLAPGFFQDQTSRLIADSRDILAPPLLHDGVEVPSLLVDVVRDRVASAL